MHQTFDWQQFFSKSNRKVISLYQLEKEKKDSQKNFAKRDATLERLSDNLLRGFDIEMRQYLEPSKNEIDVESDSD